MNYKDVIADLQALASPEKAKNSAWFFKTGPGQYGEGDVFIGVTVPDQRKVAKKYVGLDIKEIAKLLTSKYHEYRLTALIILVSKFDRSDSSTQQKIYDFYLANTNRINNWDLVDLSAEYIVGPLVDQAGLLRLAKSKNIWQRRIAMLACFYYIKKGDCKLAFKVIEVLKNDKHDLIQKAVGWMLREIGKRCGYDVLEDWLKKDDNYKRLPRTTLRYSIEHFDAQKRAFYLKT